MKLEHLSLLLSGATAVTDGCLHALHNSLHINPPPRFNITTRRDDSTFGVL
jgi:hypothetical protein